MKYLYIIIISIRFYEIDLILFFFFFFCPLSLQLLGEIVAPTMDAWVGDRSVDWIEIAYVNGLTIDGGGLIDGHGSTWWQKCRSCKRPAV